MNFGIGVLYNRFPSKREVLPNRQTYFTYPLIALWLLYVPLGLTLKSSTFCPHCVFMCFMWIWEQTAIISLYTINCLDFITETECVYCAVRAESLSRTNCSSSLNGWKPKLLPACIVDICRLIWMKLGIEIIAWCLSAHMSFRENRRCRESHIFHRQIDSCFTWRS